MSVAPDMESVAPGATKALSRFAADLRYDEIDAVALHKARSHTLDTIGVCLAGGQEDVAQIAGAVIEDVMAEGDVPVPGRTRRADMLSVAFLAGTACHGLELDDGFRAGGMHPGCVVIPAALAVGYRAGVDGKRFLTAIVAGYEVAARIAALVHPRPRWRGFHNTATIGVFAAAATTGVLKGFDADTVENAFGIAASCSSGIRSYTRGGDVKRIHPGLAARDGILAALLAEKGHRGAPDVLESPDGFLFAFAGEEGMEAAKGMDVFAAGGHLNSRFAIADCYIKPHACCRHLHPGIDALLAITGREGIAPESVTGIEVDTYRVAATHGGIGWSSMTSAQMSFPFALGAALEYGAVDLARYSEQGRGDARVLGHCDKVTVRPDDALDAVYPERRPARVILHTADGRRFEERVDEPLGSAGNAVPDDMLEDKFRRLAGPVIGAERTEALAAQLWKIDGLESVAPLAESLAVDKEGIKGMADTASEISPVMRDLSAYLAGALDRELPPDVAEKGKFHLLDTIAAMVSGSRLPPGEATVAYIRTLGGVEEAVVAGSGIVTSAVNAALANGMLAHADETDDSHKTSRSHLGCGVVPAALAMAEREGASGTELLRAVVLGYDIGARTTLALGVDGFYDAGHSTHTFAPLFGAGAAAGALARLNQDQMRWMLSYTAQQASGVNCWQRDLDHIEKAFDFGGMASRNGVTSATMVQAGFTGVDDVFSGPRNFFFAFNAAQPETLVDGLGTRFEVVQTNIKKWSVGSPIQAPLDCVEAMLAKRKIDPGQVDRVALHLSDREHSVVDNRHMPDICIQHMVAIMLLDGTVTFASSHDDARMDDAAVRALRERIDLIGEPNRERRTTLVEITLRDGTVLTETQDAVRGTPDNPMTRDEVETKAYDLMAPILGEAASRDLVTRIREIESVDDVRTLRPLLMA